MSSRGVMSLEYVEGRTTGYQNGRDGKLPKLSCNVDKARGQLEGWVLGRLHAYELGLRKNNKKRRK